MFRLYAASAGKTPVRGVLLCRHYSRTRSQHHTKATKRFGDTLYNVLEISDNATMGQVKAAYYDLSKRFHPDRTGNDPESESSERFTAVSDAYQVLSDKNKRRMYDRELAISRGKVSHEHRRRPSHFDPRRPQDFHPGHARRYNFDFGAHYEGHYGEEERMKAKHRRATEKHRAAEEKLARQQEGVTESRLTVTLLALAFIGLSMGIAQDNSHKALVKKYNKMSGRQIAED
eukprot:Clim_evm11s205 gene=Clim_evmTU11s205